MPLIIFFLLSGCSKPEELTENPSELAGHVQSESLQAHGRELEDPYAIHNILKAFKNLKEAGSFVPVDQIEPNHVYLRFFPGNEQELEILKCDSSLVFFDYPLNSENTEGEPVMDRSSTVIQPGWQYCVVPAGKKLPPVHYEVIYDVFIPPDDEATLKSSSGMIAGFYDELVNESARLTGNLILEKTSGQTETKSSPGRWTPKGRIRVWDDLLNMYIPVNHVKVHARWFTHIETDFTDEEGYFRMKSFRQPVNYSIKWENALFTIRDGLFLQAWYNGPKKKEEWNLDISGGKSKMFATLHRAAYRHFYGNNLGLCRPRLNSGGRTKICYMDGNGTGRFIGDFSAGGIIPDIQVWGNGGKRATNIVFGTLTHELGHQLHSQYVGNIKFLRTANIIRESWAEAVEWALTNDEYNTLGTKYNVGVAKNYDHQYNKHVGWPFVYDRDYSPIFIDLIDKVNQREAKGPDHPNDLIAHYTISFINHNLLKKSEDIPSLYEEVKNNRMEGVDDFKISELFHLYMNPDSPKSIAGQ